MKVVDDLGAVPSSSPLHVAIGMFDGVHHGHQMVIESARNAARLSGGMTVVLTFHPHPSVYFRPEAPTPQMMPPEVKEHILAAFGVDTLIRLPFGPAIANVPASEFLPMLKTRLPSLQSVSVGENFRFGKGRLGDIGTLVATGWENQIEVISVPRLRIDGEPVSSTRIRTILPTGPIESVNRLLGYPYFALGPVQSGRRLGRTIGFPTLNQAWAPEIHPPFGVYAVRVSSDSSPNRPPLPGVANYGLRPTVEDNAPTPLIETHLLGNPVPPIPTTGDVLRVEFLQFIRPEQKFPDLDSLRAQIARDRVAAELFHS